MGIEDELGEFPRGCAIAEAVEVGVFLQGDETVLADMVQGTLHTLFEGVRRGRGWVAGCALEGVLLVDVVNQLFVHFEVDKGVCRSLPYFGQSWPKEAAEDEWDDAMFIHEYEAGYRAIFWASFYKIIDPKLAKIDNIGNLWKFWNHNDTSNATDKKICDFLKKKGVDGKVDLEVKLMDETIFPQFTKKYSEYGDPRLDLSFINYDI
jgi:hypothetical protein